MPLDTRVYFDSASLPPLPMSWGFIPSDAGGIGGWDTYDTAVSRAMHIGTAGSSAYNNLVATSTSAERVLVVQFCALVATGTVFTAGTDTLAMQLLASYSGPSPMDTALVMIGVVNLEGTTLLANLTGGIVNFAAAGAVNLTSKRNKSWITSTATYATSYTTPAPTWLVIEVGGAASGASAPVGLSLRLGEGSGSGSDLPTNQTQTTDGVPWLAHSSNGNTPLTAAGCRMEGTEGIIRTW